ncbi:MAG TPA: DUF1573 domain-containing protein, partial [Bacteroidia bacterium]|nr:DUF1573 domain-containing protein [Bacteroidia bacterium]
MKKLLFVFIAFALASATYGQTTTERSDNCSEITLGKDTLDLGKVMHNSDVIKSVSIKNTGRCPLIISSVTGGFPREFTCSKTYYQPGDSGAILIIYPTDKFGPISQVLTINSNAKNSIKQLYIKGLVMQENICGQLTFDKDTIDLGPIPYVFGKHFVINVYNKSKCAMTFHTQPPDDSFMNIISFTDYPINPGDTGKVDIHLGGKVTGSYKGSLSVFSPNSSPNIRTVFLKGHFLSSEETEKGN